MLLHPIKSHAHRYEEQNKESVGKHSKLSEWILHPITISIASTKCTYETYSVNKLSINE